MIKSILLLSCALTLGQAADRTEWQLAPQLAPGLEFVYRGAYIEESLIPNVQYQRHYRLESNLFILDAGAKDWHVAVMTSLRLHDPRQPQDDKGDGPSSVRLGQLHIDQQGRLRTLDKKLVEVPLSGPATLESGCFVPAPLIRVRRNSAWDIADEGKPIQHWQFLGVEAVAGVTCVKVGCVQQSDDWDHTRADHTAWRRRDTLWIWPQFNVAQKVERIIEQRAPARDAPTHRATVRYELESHMKFSGKFFDDRKQDALKSCKFQDDAQALIREPQFYRTQIDGMVQRITFHLERHEKTPYRQAVVHLKSALENAQKGEAPVPHVADEPPPPAVKVLAVGDQAADFTVSSFTESAATRLLAHRGKPVLIFFYNPATELGKDVLEYVRRLSGRHGQQLAVMAMAVASDEDLVRTQHQTMKLTFPILDGNGMRLTFGAVQTPRFVLLDGNGVVRLAQTGWGSRNVVRNRGDVGALFEEMTLPLAASRSPGAARARSRKRQELPRLHAQPILFNRNAAIRCYPRFLS
jgi:peroxiredoxin